MIVEILARHADELAFLWFRRDAAAVAPHHDARTLAALDERLDAHLDGLRIAGPQGLEISVAALDPEEPGSAFTVAVLAAEQASLEAMKPALALADSPPVARAVASALAWVPFAQAEKVLPALLSPEAPPSHLFIGLSATAAHRKDPGAPLSWAVDHSDPRARARALRAAGELARADLLPALRAQMRSPDEAPRFWATWSCALLGETAAFVELWNIADTGSPHAERAASLAARRGDPRDIRGHIEDLALSPRTARAALLAAEAFGDPALFPWLLDRMSTPALARLAAEALSSISGAAIEGPLAGRPPEGFSAGPTDNPIDTGVTMDPDHHLPWPDIDALRTWCMSRERTFRRGARHLAGAPLTPSQVDTVLRTASQRRKSGAALESVLLRPGPLPEPRARDRR
ncbi:MAG: TIGR02270 family protein [Polyangiaceae bacterium]